MVKKPISQRRRAAGQTTLAALGAVWLSIQPPTAEPLTSEGINQIEKSFVELDEVTTVAREAVSMMDENVFGNAPDELSSREQVNAMLGQMPDGYNQMLERGTIMTKPADYMVDNERVAIAKGALTPWEGDDVVIIPWDNDRERIVVHAGTYFPGVLAHEYIHYVAGVHSIPYILDAAKDEFRSEVEWTTLAREHGDIPYMMGDLYWLLDEWGGDNRTAEGELRHLDVAEVFGIDKEEAEILAEKSKELTGERNEMLAEASFEKKQKGPTRR